MAWMHSTMLLDTISSFSSRMGYELEPLTSVCANVNGHSAIDRERHGGVLLDLVVPIVVLAEGRFIGFPAFRGFGCKVVKRKILPPALSHELEFDLSVHDLCRGVYLFGSPGSNSKQFVVTVWLMAPSTTVPLPSSKSFSKCTVQCFWGCNPQA
jgi:hypothetical protein